MDKDQILKAIEINVCFIKPWRDKIRCFDSRMGYGIFVDLTPEEYQIFLQSSTLTKVEQIARLENVQR